MQVKTLQWLKQTQRTTLLRLANKHTGCNITPCPGITALRSGGRPIKAHKSNHIVSLSCPIRSRDVNKTRSCEKKGAKPAAARVTVSIRLTASDSVQPGSHCVQQEACSPRLPAASCSGLICSQLPHTCQNNSHGVGRKPFHSSTKAKQKSRKVILFPFLPGSTTGGRSRLSCCDPVSKPGRCLMESTEHLIYSTRENGSFCKCVN